MHLFLLLVFTGTGDGKELISDTMTFQDIYECNEMARQVVKRYGFTNSPDYFVTAYCVPKFIGNE